MAKNVLTVAGAAFGAVSIVSLTLAVSSAINLVFSTDYWSVAVYQLMCLAS